MVAAAGAGARERAARAARGGFGRVSSRFAFHEIFGRGWKPLSRLRERGWGEGVSVRRAPWRSEAEPSPGAATLPTPQAGEGLGGAFALRSEDGGVGEAGVSVLKTGWA